MVRYASQPRRSAILPPCGYSVSVHWILQLSEFGIGRTLVTSTPRVQEILTGTDVSTLRRIYDEVPVDDQRAEWARAGIG